MGFFSQLFSSLDPFSAAQNPTGVTQNQIHGLTNEQTQTNPLSAQSFGALAPAQSFFTKALSGDSGALRDLLGPNVSTVIGQYDTAAKTATELGPRGGGRNATLAQAPFQKAAAYGTALAGARSGAAAGLTGVGSAEGNIAQGITNSKNQVLGLLTNAQEEAQKQKNQAFGALGSGIGSLFAPGLTKLITGAIAG